MPQSRLPVVFAEFGEKYRPLTYLTVPGSTILIVSSYEVVSELLDERAALYADRPRMVMMGELIGVEKETQMKRYDAGWRLQRKYLKQALSANGVKANYGKFLENAWVGYLKSLISDPDHFPANISRMIVLAVVKYERGCNAQPSYTINALKQLRDADVELYLFNPDDEAIKHSGFAFFAAVSETKEFTFRSLLLAMILFPEVQFAARAEIDRVIGKDRLPNFEDRENNPYIRAMVLESLRWNPGGPIGVPHRLTKNDMFEGYLLPKGTSVFSSIWSETRLTPRYLKDPSSFIPERYMEELGKRSSIHVGSCLASEAASVPEASSPFNPSGSELP
ncbi:hypothetical protein FRB90_002255 [Tulasnella sp. 427]|nr:hypothetical protein FRB90_002255 [Tulasnella sp. 427]